MRRFAQPSWTRSPSKGSPNRSSSIAWSRHIASDCHRSVPRDHGPSGFYDLHRDIRYRSRRKGLDRLFEIVSHVCREFRGTNRFNAGDGYCLTFPEVGLVLGGVEGLAEEWAAFDRLEQSHCPMTIA